MKSFLIALSLILIASFSMKAQTVKLKYSEGYIKTKDSVQLFYILVGEGKDTILILNGGVFGSLMSTPIINEPQSAILGMHSIKERPIVVNGEIKIRPMMYLALSYDHRVIDGSTSVTYLVKVKNLIEDPVSLLLEL